MPSEGTEHIIEGDRHRDIGQTCRLKPHEKICKLNPIPRQ